MNASREGCERRPSGNATPLSCCGKVTGLDNRGTSLGDVPLDVENREAGIAD
jgi:hypothetical protein